MSLVSIVAKMGLKRCLSGRRGVFFMGVLLLAWLACGSSETVARGERRSGQGGRGLQLFKEQAEENRAPTGRTLLGDDDDDDEDEDDAEWPTVYPVFPRTTVTGAFTPMYIFVTVPREVYQEADMTLYNFCRVFAPYVRLAKEDSYMHFSMSAYLNLTSGGEFEDSIGCAGGPCDWWEFNTQWYVKAARAQYIEEVSSVLIPAWPEAPDHRVRYCMYQANKLAPRDCLHGPEAGWGQNSHYYDGDDHGFPFTDPYMDAYQTDANDWPIPSGYGTSCTGLYRANVTFEEWPWEAGVSLNHTKNKEFNWTVSRDMSFSRDMFEVRRKMQKGDQEPEYFYAHNEGEVDSVVAMNVAETPDWLRVDLAYQQNSKVLVQSHPQNPTIYYLIKAGQSVKFKVTFNALNLEYSERENILMRTEARAMQQFTTRMVLEIERAVLVLPDDVVLSNNNVATFSSEIREGQLSVVRMKLGNNGNLPLMWNTVGGSNFDWITVTTTSSTLMQCACDQPANTNLLCGSQAYYDDWGESSFAQCRSNDFEFTVLIDANTLSLGTHVQTIEITTTDADLPSFGLRFEVEVLNNMLVMTQSMVELKNVGPGETAHSTITVSNFHYNQDLIDTFGSDLSHREAMEKTLNSSVVSMVSHDNLAYPWLDVYIPQGLYGYSESKTLNVTATHGPNVVPGSYAGSFNMSSMIYDDGASGEVSAVQIDEIAVYFEAVVGPPSNEESYVVWNKPINSNSSTSASDNDDSNEWYYGNTQAYSGGNYEGFMSNMVGTAMGQFTTSQQNWATTTTATGTEYALVNYTTSTDPIELTAGETVTLTVHTVDQAGNARDGAGGMLLLKHFSTTGVYGEDVYSVDEQDGTHNLHLTLTESGTFGINIFLRNEATFSWEGIDQAPSLLTCLPAPMSHTSSFFDDQEFASVYTVGVNTTLTLSLRDSYMNVASYENTGMNALVAQLVNKVDSEVTFAADFGYESSQEGMIFLTFNVTRSGSYQLEWDNAIFPVSMPNENNLRYKAATLSWGNSTFEVPEAVDAGQASEMKIVAKDQFGNTLNPNELLDDMGMTFQATINSTDVVGFQNLTLNFAVDENDFLVASLNLTETGYYNITVIGYDEVVGASTAGHLVAGSPFSVRVNPGAPKYDNFVVSDPNNCTTNGTAGIGCTAGFTAKDRYGNVIGKGDRDPSIKETFLFHPLNGSDGLTELPISGQISYSGGGQYTLTFTATASGTYERDELISGQDLGLNKIGEETDIPFGRYLTVGPSDPDVVDLNQVPTTAFKVDPQTVVAGDNFTVTVDLKDQFGNPIVLRSEDEVMSHLQLTFKGEGGAVSFNLLKGNILSLDPLQISVNLTTTAAAMEAHLRVGGSMSPSIAYFQVISAPVHAPLTYATFESPTTAGNDLEITVYAQDRFSNKADQHGIDADFMEHVTLLASSSSGALVELNVSRHRYDQDNQYILYMDFNLTQAGMFALDLKFHNVSLLRTKDSSMASSSAINVKSAPIDLWFTEMCAGRQCLEYGDLYFNNTMTAGQEYILAIKAKDGYQNQIPSINTALDEASDYRFTCAVTIPGQVGTEAVEQVFYTEYDPTFGEYTAAMTIFGFGTRQLHCFSQYIPDDSQALQQKLNMIREWNPFAVRWNATQVEDFYLAKQDLSDYLFSKQGRVVPRICTDNMVGTGNGVDCVCKPGYHRLGDLCSPCAVGSYKQDASNATECQVCDSQFTTKAEASSAAAQCVCRIGFYQVRDGDKECKLCPEGTICPTGSTLATLRLLPGKWRASPNATMILDCQRKEHCVGGLTTKSIDEGNCLEGHSGVLCAVCKEGWKSSVFEEGNCEVCDVKSEEETDGLVWGKWVAFCFALVTFFTLLSFLVNKRKHQSLHLALTRHRSRHSRREKVSAMEKLSSLLETSPIPLIKIFYNYTVHVSVGGLLRVKLSAVLQNFFESSDSVASGGIDLGMSVFFEGCSSPVPNMNYYSQLTVILLIPVFLVLFSALFFLCKFLAMHVLSSQRSRGETVTHKIGAGKMDSKLLYDSGKSGHSVSNASENFTSWLVSILILMFMVHSAVASKVSGTLRKSLQEDEFFAAKTDSLSLSLSPLSSSTASSTRRTGMSSRETTTWSATCPTPATRPTTSRVWLACASTVLASP